MKWLTAIVLALYMVQISGISALAQDPSPTPRGTGEGKELESDVTTTPLTAKEAESKWKEFASDKGWQALSEEVSSKGFKRLDQATWAFRATIKPAEGKSVEALFCAFDFYSPDAIKDKTFQTASMIWGDIGGRVYKAYLVYPKGANGAKDITAALAESQEWFADENGKVQKAHSFGTRFSKCINGGKHKVSLEGPFGFKYQVTANCKTACLAYIATCGGVAAILELASGGLGTPALIILFGACALAGCGSCFALCALSSL